jgi:hypothetical protein
LTADWGDGDYGENVFIDKPGLGIKDSWRDVGQIHQALRDFVLQDTAHLRRDAETATSEASQRVPEAPQMVSEFVHTPGWCGSCFPRIPM